MNLSTKQAGRSSDVRAPSQNGKVAERAGKSALTKSPLKKGAIDVSPSKLSLKKQKSSYLSDDEEDVCAAFAAEISAIDEFLANRKELAASEALSSAAASDKAIENEPVRCFFLKKPRGTNTASDDGSRTTESTQFDSEIINRLKKRKALYCQVTCDLSESERAVHYSNIIFNHVNTHADRVINKCDQTLDKIERLESRNKNILGSSKMIEDLHQVLQEM